MNKKQYIKICKQDINFFLKPLSQIFKKYHPKNSKKKKPFGQAYYNFLSEHLTFDA